GGNDGYCPAKVTHTLGGGRSARGMGSIGLFIDAGGKDLYGTRDPNGTSWTKETYGAGIDEADPPPVPGQKPPPRAKLSPEEAEKRVRDGAWDEEKKSWDLEKLWGIARSWAVGEMRFVVPVAIEKLGTLGDPAMEKALSVVGSKDGLELLAVRKTLAHDREKSIPRLVEILAHEDPRWRRQAAGFLADLGAKDTVEKIVPLLGDEKTALGALDAIARLDAKDQWPAVAKLLQTEPPERTKVAALRCLEKLAVPESSYLALLEMLLGSPFTVRFAAEDVAVSFGAPMAKHLAHEAMRTEGTSIQARRHAIRALGRIGAPESLPVLVELSDHENWEIRYEVAGALKLYLDTPDAAIAREVLADRARREANDHVKARLR
ncbi:MAG: HEAT repeat domain-containing protein, partial [Planctomycetota bacterium]